MKKLLAAFFAASLSLSLSALDVMDYVPLKEGVKSYTCTEYSIATKFGDYFKTITGKVTHTIDASGNDVETAQYSARGNLENTIRTAYDSMGNILAQDSVDSSNALLWKTESVYKKGLKTETNDYDAAGNLTNKTICKYENDRLVDETGYDACGALIWKIIYKYDEAGRTAKELNYLGDGSLDSETVYTYKDDGKADTIRVYDTLEGKKQYVFRYASGLLTEITVYDVLESGTKVIERLIIKYDDNSCVAKVSDYNVAEKFGGTVNELVYMAEYTYTF